MGLRRVSGDVCEPSEWPGNGWEDVSTFPSYYDIHPEAAISEKPSSLLECIVNNSRQRMENAQRLYRLLSDQSGTNKVRVECVSGTIECLSSSPDVSGFFMNESYNPHEYQRYLTPGQTAGGDALTGLVTRIIERRLDPSNNSTELQLELDLSDNPERPRLYYLNLEQALGNCMIQAL